ncbi:MAG: nuclear transport factor 2 family protein [Mycobacteriales bacterium]
MDEVTQAFHAIWSTGSVEEDWEHWPDHLTEDVLYVERVFGTMHGREQVRTWITELMAVRADVHAVLNWYLVKGDRVVFDMTNRYYHPDPAQPPLDFAGLTVLQYGGDGLFRYEEDYWDTGGAKAAYEAWSAAVQEHGGKGLGNGRFASLEAERKADNYAVLARGSV